MNIKRLINQLTAIAVMLVAFTAGAAEPQGYYSAAEGKTGQALLKALEGIVGSHTTISYDGLWDLYKYADVGSDGYILDMYSTAKFKPGTNQCGSYSNVGDCYNREHSFPKSWFNDASPMVSDAFHIYPTDGKVNNQRSNYPFGVCANGTYLAGTSKAKPLGKLGKSTYSGYSGTVFEPDDIYKGDFARSYFYMAAAYNNRIANWNSDMLNKTSYPAFATWAINMLLEWNRLDPVSDKETKRNQAVYDGNGGKYKQNNRNPFIDHPELAEYIWGNKVGQPWYANASADPTITSPMSTNPINLGVVATGSTSSATVQVKGVNLTEDIEISISGNGFTTSATSVSASDAMAGKDIIVYYVAPATAGTYSGTLIVESSECATVRVPVNVTVVSGIPASAANITGQSFVAKWTYQKDATNYNLYVYGSDGKTVLSGYPKQVTASAGTYTVSGLAPLTTYYFKLTSDRLESNLVEVNTLDVDHIIDIVTDGTFNFEAIRNQTTLPVIEAQVYTENVNEAVTVTVSGDKFDISLDRRTWSKTLTVDSEGETFYIRLNDVSQLGTFTGILRASSASYAGDEEDLTAVVSRPGSPLRGDVNGDDEVDVSDINAVVQTVLTGDRTLWGGRDDANGDGTVDINDVNFVLEIIMGHEPPTPPAEKQTYTEDWEDLTTGGYWTQPVTGNTWEWDFKDAGIWADTQKRGKLSCRLGKSATSAITMAEDIATGASHVSFYASTWSASDGTVDLSLDYSTDGGKTWTTVKKFSVTNTTMQEFSTDVNIAGNVRFRFVQSTGSRGNIDDIAITDNPNAKAATPVQQFTDGRTWEAVSSGNGITVTTARKATIEIYNLDAQEVARFKINGMRTVDLPAGTYVVVAGKQSKKVVVK